MSSGIDIQFVRDRYRQMSDDELIRVATRDAVGLTPEAQEVVKEEVARRNLDPNIVKGVMAQNKEYSTEEINNYCTLVRELPCPDCGQEGRKLNGAKISEVMSFILFSQYKRILKVACPDCLDKANDKAMTKTAVLGWWGIRGFIWTIKAIKTYTNNKKAIRLDEPNPFFIDFVFLKIGEIETYRDNREKLVEIISG